MMLNLKFCKKDDPGMASKTTLMALRDKISGWYEESTERGGHVEVAFTKNTYRFRTDELDDFRRIVQEALDTHGN